MHDCGNACTDRRSEALGIVITDENSKITDFEEKPENPRSNLASMGNLHIQLENSEGSSHCKIRSAQSGFPENMSFPYCHEKGAPMYAYEFNGYWKDVGTLNSYWEANMELIDIVPEFNLYEEYWKIYTKSEILPPQYIAPEGAIERSIIGEGSEILRKGIQFRYRLRRYHRQRISVVRDSIIMNNTVIGSGCELNKAIIAENVQVGEGVKMGVGEEAENDIAPHIYNTAVLLPLEKRVRYQRELLSERIRLCSVRRRLRTMKGGTRLQREIFD